MFVYLFSILVHRIEFKGCMVVIYIKKSRNSLLCLSGGYLTETTLFFPSVLRLNMSRMSVSALLVSNLYVSEIPHLSPSL